MKKYICIIAIIATAVGYTNYHSQKTEKLNGITLENVEALASGESSWPTTCYGVGYILCPPSLWVQYVEF